MLATAVAHASPTFSISELAQEFDLTTRAIRFYEDSGLLTPQRSGRNRVYSARDRTRLKLTLRGKRLGQTFACRSRGDPALTVAAAGAAG